MHPATPFFRNLLRRGVELGMKGGETAPTTISIQGDAMTRPRPTTTTLIIPAIKMSSRTAKLQQTEGDASVTASQATLEVELCAAIMNAGHSHRLVEQLCQMAMSMGFVAGPEAPFGRLTVEKAVLAMDSRTVARAAAFTAASLLLSQHASALRERQDGDSPNVLSARAHMFAETVVRNDLPSIDVNKAGLDYVLMGDVLEVGADGLVALVGAS